MQKTINGSERRDDKERLSLALDVSSAGVWELNVKRDEFHFDRRFHEILGYAMGELPVARREWRRHHHPDEIDAMAARFQAHIRGEVPFYESEHRIRSKEGEWRWFLTRGKIVGRDEKGEVERVVGIAMDVTDRKRVEETLRASMRATEVRNKINQVFLTVPDEKMYGEVLQIVLEVMDSPYGVFGFIAESGDLIAPSMTRFAWDQCEIPDKDVVFPRTSWGGIWGRALNDAQTVCSNGPLDVPKGHVSISRALSVPIVHHEGVIGLFTIANKPEDYDEDDVHLLEELAADVAPVLKARLERDRKEAERVRSETQLRESEADLVRAQKIAQIGSWDWDLVSQELKWSEGMHRITGVPKQQMTWELAQSVTHPEDEDTVLSVLESALSGGGAFSCDFRMVQPDGDVRYVRDEGQIIRDAAGKPVRAFGVMQDITERKRTEEETANREQFLDRIIEQSPFATWIADANGTLQQANPALKKMLGLTDEQLVGKYNVLLDPLVEEQGLTDLVRSVFEAGETIHFNCQWCGGKIPSWDLKGSRTVDIEATMFPIHNQAGELTNVVLHWIDISARLRAEQEREDLIAKLERQNAELERFTYTVSHDLKSPLITIKGYVGMLRESLAGTESDLVAEDLGRISGAADKMGDLLRDLLELSRVGRLVNPSEKVALGELAAEVLELVGVRAEQRGVQVEISPDLPVVFGDRLRLQEVLQNLIDNGVKYMGEQPRPRIDIGSRRDGDETICYVRDNGIGIDPSYHERVFGLFDQLDQTMEGSGIGLALVKRIVEVHGGRAWIESDGTGHGTSVCFTIPENAKSTEGEASQDRSDRRPSPVERPRSP